MALDFKDAFKQLRVKPSERKHLAVQIEGGFFASLTVLLGICTGPLVWAVLRPYRASQRKPSFAAALLTTGSSMLSGG